MNVERYQWCGIDDLSRIETAVVRLGEDSLRAHGGSVSTDYATAWHLKVGAGWVTEELAVSSFGDGWKRSLTLARDSSGCWSIDADHLGEVELPAPGLHDPSILHGAIDCDLGLCPLTNIMPVRRLGLLSHQVEPTPPHHAEADGTARQQYRFQRFPRAASCSRYRGS
ncbi:putative glycolipid-binding domain-containing protein [Brachybacterium hainanense]|uniref:Glycolipid-binding domain-containing protein n=1 Tax=Brachybacterium hainanense TaxID=1541174 RepID=A0ABV6R7M8_9MICO